MKASILLSMLSQSFFDRVYLPDEYFISQILMTLSARSMSKRKQVYLVGDAVVKSAAIFEDVVDDPC